MTSDPRASGGGARSLQREGGQQVSDWPGCFLSLRSDWLPYPRGRVLTSPAQAKGQLPILTPQQVLPSSGLPSDGLDRVNQDQNQQRHAPASGPSPGTSGAATRTRSGNRRRRDGRLPRAQEGPGVHPRAPGPSPGPPGPPPAHLLPGRAARRRQSRHADGGDLRKGGCARTRGAVSSRGRSVSPEPERRPDSGAEGLRTGGTHVARPKGGCANSHF